MDFRTITSFKNINIIPKTLVFCDIDETVLKYKDIDAKWWLDKIDYHYSKVKNYKHANDMAYSEWKDIVYRHRPEHTDATGFETMVKNIYNLGGELVFITARQNDLEDLTIEHLRHVLNRDFLVKFCGDEPKGIVINNMPIDRSGYNRVLFIDDNERHLKSVYNVFGDQFIYYRFDMEGKNIDEL